MNGWGDYRPVKKQGEEKKDFEFSEVARAFNAKYGKGTLVQPGQED